MADLLGPADAPFTVSVRPAETRVFPVGDTWFKDCSAPGAGDGSKLSAIFMNGLLGQVRRAIRGMGVTEDNLDDDMLLKAIQAIAGVSVSLAAARNLPIFPHVTATNGLLGATGSAAQVVVTSGNTFIHRGVFLINTASYDAAVRTFATVANKTYHLRWRWNAGAPAFGLYDVADAGYNPTTALETSTIFDSTYDDMLIAKVVTNGSNVPTITLLMNKDRLIDQITWTGVPTSASGLNFAKRTFVSTWNWARTPLLNVVPIKIVMITNPPDFDWRIHPNAPLHGVVGQNDYFHRYGTSTEVMIDSATDFTFLATIRA